MATATLPEAPVLTMAEIERLYDGEWVVIEYPLVNDASEVLGGRVAFHASSRDSADEFASTSSAGDIAVFFAGELVSDLAMLTPWLVAPVDG